MKDPDTQQAATKIQASFRGSQARKEVVALKQQRTAIDDEDTPTTQDDSKKSIEIQMPTQEEVDEVAEEEVDIDLDDPELEGAATKIQAGYRGMKTRQELKIEEKEDVFDIDLDDPDTQQAASKIQAGFRGSQARKEVQKMKENKDDKKVTQEEEFDIDLDDPQTQVAATKIQASFRGSQTRKEMQQKKHVETVEEPKEQEEIDIDLNDPEVEQAATKIQAGFKGKKARDEVQKMKEEKNMKDQNIVELDTEEIDIDLNDPEVEMAATKIQAGFKGKKAREEVRKIKVESEQQIKEEKDEIEINIDLKDPEVEQAATKIQAGYKGMKTRKELKGEPKENLQQSQFIEEVDIDLEDPDVEVAATKIQAGYKGMKTRKELREKMEETTESKEIDIDLNDPEVEMAATKIQAGYKGMKTRKEMKVVHETDISDPHQNGTNQEHIDIDLADPEVAMAATKIQAGYKGMKTRKELKETQDNKLDQPEDIDIDLKDPEVEMAATKIQAGYKGMKTRKDLKEEKDQTEEEIKNGDLVKENASIDIDLNDPEVEVAATKIQAGYKGMKTRKDLKRGELQHDSMFTNGEKKDQIITGNEHDLIDPDMDKAATKIQAGYKGMKTRKEIKKKKYDESIVKNIDPDMEVAATKIQAGYRGMRDRGKVKQKRLANIDENVDTILEENVDENEEKLITEEVPKIDEEIDIDLNDPEVELAATKIQAGFKGKKARDEVKMMKEEGYTSNNQAEVNVEFCEEPKEVTQEEEIDIDLNDPEVEMAATKIQAGFKGKKAREEVKMMKNEMTIKSDEVQDSKLEENNEEEIDIDLNDPEVEMAATKIQAGFKGKKARDEVKLMKNERIGKSEEVHISREEEEIDIDLNDPEVEMAATKIQAGFKGKKARDEVRIIKEEMKVKADGDGDETEQKNETSKEEEIDIDLNDPEVEMAATKIQAGFKGKKARDEVKMMKNEMAEKNEDVKDSKNENDNIEEIDIDLDDPEVEMAATKIQAGFKGKKAREEVKIMKEELTVKSEETQQINEKAGEEEEIDIDLNDPEVEMAATKIQAGFKGKKAREEVKMMKTEMAEKNEEVQGSDAKEEVIDIDLNDPDVEIAATKIQAGYKGMKTRKEMKESNKAGEEDTLPQEKDIDIDLNDPEVEVAATKIQAGYKGMKARKDLRDRRQGDGEEEVKSIVEECRGEGLNGKVETVNDHKPLKNGDEVAREVKDEEENQDKPEDDMKEEIATEMLIQGAAEGQEQELRPQSHTDDGYTSPEQTLTAVSSFDNHSPVKSLNLELTGTAALIHDPNSEILLVSQESVTDSELLEVQYDLTQSTDDRLKVRVTEEEMMEEESMMSSLQTVANADDLIEDQVDTESKLDGENSLEKDLAPPKDDVIEETVDEVEEVNNVGATPFDQYKGHPQIQVVESVQSTSSVQTAQDEKGEQLMLYYSKGSYNSEKVLVYLYERGIDFSSFNVDLSKGEQFTKWFLKLNPKAEVPVLTIKDPTKEPSDPRALRIITDSTRIMHSLDSKFSDILSPTLVPMSSDTASYQLHVYFAAIFDQVSFLILNYFPE